MPNKQLSRATTLLKILGVLGLLATALIAIGAVTGSPDTPDAAQFAVGATGAAAAAAAAIALERRQTWGLIAAALHVACDGGLWLLGYRIGTLWLVIDLLLAYWLAHKDSRGTYRGWTGAAATGTPAASME